MRTNHLHLLSILLGAWMSLSNPVQADTGPYVVVLGIAQDAGHPQAGCNRPCCAQAWDNPKLGHRVASLGIVDPATGQRWLIDATPDLPVQLRALDALQPSKGGKILDGILLTHAHMGHYTGLLHLGREVMGARSIPVWAMPRMTKMIQGSAPWEQLVKLENIRLRELEDNVDVALNDRIGIRPIRVPHRDEYSETVGFIITGPKRKVLYLPDIDKWTRWKTPIEEVLATVDHAYLDGTFYSDGELPGRSMAEIPHPFVVESLRRFSSLDVRERAKVEFIHFNHTNPLLQPKSAAAKTLADAGLGVAQEGARFDL